MIYIKTRFGLNLTSANAFGEAMSPNLWKERRRYFIGGSDARIIMGDDEAALLRFWREKRGEIDPEDLSGNLIVQLGLATEELNRRWYQANTGQLLTDIQRQIRHPVLWDGCYTGWSGRSYRRSVRSKVHAALGILGGSGG
jgi:hypothetical protein